MNDIKRVQNYSTEAEVYQEGSNRINVDIPGVSDANAILEELGKPGSLIFVDEAGQTILNGNQVATAKPVITDENGIKKYMVDLTFNDRVRVDLAVIDDGDSLAHVLCRRICEYGFSVVGKG